MENKIPISVLIATKNEEKNLPRCLSALERFDEIVVIDSGSRDATIEIAKSFGVKTVDFLWNGEYPKKRQWCLDYLSLKYDRIFFVDADEEVTQALCDEISRLDWADTAGYFVKGAYVINNTPLRFGLKNNKLCLFDRRKIEFPVVDDLDLPGMGEIEGHYQPVLKAGISNKIGSLRNALLHHAMEDLTRHQSRHNDYAAWERGMRRKQAYPNEPGFIRRILKTVFNHIPLRPHAAFLHSYIFKFGLLDGVNGFFLAKSRYMYYRNN
jgi:glycosyltransferase involved in cell wall biosynthesis